MGPVLAVHIAGGGLAIAAGYAALVARKGARVHRTAGLVFVAAMLLMGTGATVLAVDAGKYATALGGPLVVYLTITALLTMRRRTAATLRVERLLVAVAVLLGLGFVFFGQRALESPNGTIEGGVPAPPIFLNGVVALLAAAGDVRRIRTGPASGPARLRRHLWRMCFAFFMASGAFLLGQMQVIPRPLRIMPLIIALAVLPLIAMIYYAWRPRAGRIRRGVRGTGTVASALGRYWPRRAVQR